MKRSGGAAERSCAPPGQGSCNDTGDPTVGSDIPIPGELQPAPGPVALPLGTGIDGVQLLVRNVRSVRGVWAGIVGLVVLGVWRRRRSRRRRSLARDEMPARSN